MKSNFYIGDCVLHKPTGRQGLVVATRNRNAFVKDMALRENLGTWRMQELSRVRVGVFNKDKTEWKPCVFVATPKDDLVGPTRTVRILEADAQALALLQETPKSVIHAYLHKTTAVVLESP